MTVPTENAMTAWAAAHLSCSDREHVRRLVARYGELKTRDVAAALALLEAITGCWCPQLSGPVGIWYARERRALGVPMRPGEEIR